MSNLLSSNKVVIFLRNFSFTHRIILSILFLVIIFSAWFLIFFFPLNLQLNEESSLYESNLSKQFAYQKVIKSFDAIKKNNTNLVSTYENSFKDTVSNNNALNNIFVCLQKYDFSCKSFFPINVKNKKFYTKEYYQLEIKGTFSNLLSFLTELEKFNGIAKIKDVEIKRKKQGNILLTINLRLVNN